MTRFAMVLALSATLVGCKSNDEYSVGNQPVQNPQTASAPKLADVRYASFGEPMKMSDETPLPVDQVLGNIDQYSGKYVRVTGNVTAVCEKKGCWLKMDDATGKELFVKFTCPISGRLVPLEAMGKTVIAEGTLKVKEISEAEARHMAEDAGRPQAEIEKIVGPRKQISLMAPSAKVAGL